MKRTTTSTSKAAAEAEPMSLERIMHLAEFRAALRAFQRRSEQVARSWGLTPQRYLLLLAVKGAPDGSESLSLTRIAERLHLSRNTVTELCARAEAAGLIQRRPSLDDQRVVYLHLTSEGERRLQGALLESETYREELRKCFDELVASFSASAARAAERGSG